MTASSQRQQLIALIEAACRAGARVRRACKLVGLSVRTLERWRAPSQPRPQPHELCAPLLAPSCPSERAQGDAPPPAPPSADRRVAGLRRPFTPANKLSPAEVAHAMALINSAPFSHLPPSQIVPRLADTGLYIASESSLYRLLRQHGQLRHRRAERPPQRRSKPRALVAHAVGEVFCWDITYLPSTVAGAFFYLYLFIDLFSRKIVGWQVFECESATLAAALVTDICASEGITPGRLTLHSDNGSPMKGETMLHTLQRLGVAPSRSRPSVSNDNPFSESCFRTLKYRPECPVKPFNDVLAARLWAGSVVHWYNTEHRHGNIQFVTPSQRHAGLDQDLLNQRECVYRQARDKNPKRWSKNTRNWNYSDTVKLNPDSSLKKTKNNTPKATI